MIVFSAQMIRELNENLKMIEQINGHLKVIRSFPLVSLNFLSNLKVIRGISESHASLENERLVKRARFLSEILTEVCL